MLFRLANAGWGLNLVVNVGVTVAIVGRLWYMGNKVAAISSSIISNNPYLDSILTIVESGGLYAAVTLVMLILYEIRSPLALNGLDIATQIAVRHYNSVINSSHENILDPHTSTYCD